MDYPVPIDGPPGEMLLAARRPIVRPAHVHFMVTAPGHTKLTTHVFVAGSEHLDSDPVFAVKQSLVRDFTPVDAPDEAATLGVISPFALAVCDFVLAADD
jgi:protocatechuate 3,4-dioxygenase beta subunit